MDKTSFKFEKEKMLTQLLYLNSNKNATKATLFINVLFIYLVLAGWFFARLLHLVFWYFI